MILVTGATGFLGNRVCELLAARKLPYQKTSLSLGTDLRDYPQTEGLFSKIRPTYVLNCAAFVGGIQFGYQYPADIFVNNMQMAINLLKACHQFQVKRLVNPIANCAYPAKATLFKEEEFWDGPLHESVLVYGFTRKASWIGAWAFAKQHNLDVLNLILSNMYGPADHFDEVRSHALGALVKKMVDAKRQDKPFVNVWGSGKPVREWLYIDDGAEAMLRGIDSPLCIDPVNIGVASGISIYDLVQLIKQEVGYQGEIHWDTTKPDGAPYKTVEGSKGRKLLGWAPKVELHEGIAKTVQWYLANRFN